MIAGIATPAGVELAEVARPIPNPDQVLIKVHAAGVNWGDLLTSAGALGPDSLGKPVGGEWAGEVEVGERVCAFKAGDRVATTGRGGYAEYAVADEGRLIPLSPEMPMLKAAILPMALMTAHNALKAAGRLVPNEAVLVHGGSTAVGLAAMQTAKALGAGLVLATSRSAEHRSQLATWGADLALDPTAQDWVDEVRAATGSRGADVVVDMVSGPGFPETMAAAAVQGRIVNVGRLAGGQTSIDLDRLALKRLHLVGVTFRTRTPGEVAEIRRSMVADLWERVLADEIKLPLHRSFALAEAKAVHELMRTQPYFGKMAICVADRTDPAAAEPPSRQARSLGSTSVQRSS